MRTIDINTSLDTVDGAEPGQAFIPPRYTTTRADEIRVGVFLLLATRRTTYAFDTREGLDYEELLDPSTSDAERAANVAEVVASFPGVTGISEGPTVTISDDGTAATITLRATVADGSFTVSTMI